MRFTFIFLHILLLVAGCTISVDDRTILPDMDIASGAPLMSVPAGYQVTREVLLLGALGEVHVVRMDNPESESTHIYSGGRRYLTTRPSQRAIRLAELTGADLIFYDYPGRNGTTVQRDPASLVAFGPVFLDELQARGWIGAGPKYAHGYSFGGAMSSGIARQGGFDGLILENTTPDLMAFARTQIPFYLRPFVRLQFDGELDQFAYFDYVLGANAPVLLFSGTRDRVVPDHLVERFRNKLITAGANVTYVSTDEVHGNAIYTDEAAAAFNSYYQFSRFERE